MNHVEIVQLAIAYTLLGALVFTVVITCLSLVGIVRFANQEQQRRLFAALILELVVGCVGFFFNFLKLDPTAVSRNIASNARAELGQDIARTIQRVNSPQEAPSIQTTFILGGGARVSLAVDGTALEVQSSHRTTLFLSPGDHVLSWVAIPLLNDKWEVKAEAGGQSFLLLRGQLAGGEPRAGVQRFTVK
jgi:hypothetical protein